ncbi:MAG: hypothetical protein ACEPOV_12290 [Hyphomicrobiales bacterium]
MKKYCINCNAPIAKLDTYKKLKTGSALCLGCFNRLMKKDKLLSKNYKLVDHETIINTIDDRSVPDMRKARINMLIANSTVLLITCFILKSVFFSSDETPKKDYLSFSVLDYKEYNYSMGDKFYYHILIEGKDYTEEELRSTLHHLYNQYSKDLYEPYSIFIWAYTSDVKYRLGSGNLIAGLNKILDEEIDYFSSPEEFNGLREVKRDRWGLSYDRRQIIYLSTMHMDHLINNMKRYYYEFNIKHTAEEYQLLDDYLKEDLNIRFYIEANIADSIMTEAFINGWLNPNDKYYKQKTREKLKDYPDLMKEMVYYDLQD